MADDRRYSSASAQFASSRLGRQKSAGVCDPGDPTTIGLREAGYNSRPTRSEGPDSVLFTRQSKLGTSLA
jgi:hypothetical protein